MSVSLTHQTASLMQTSCHYKVSNSKHVALWATGWNLWYRTDDTTTRCIIGSHLLAPTIASLRTSLLNITDRLTSYHTPLTMNIQCESKTGASLTLFHFIVIKMNLLEHPTVMPCSFITAIASLPS